MDKNKKLSIKEFYDLGAKERIKLKDYQVPNELLSSFIEWKNHNIFRKKQWTKLHEERLKEKAKKSYQENKEEIAKKKKEYQEKNKEKLSQYLKQYREKNKERIRKIKSNDYYKNKEQRLLNQKIYRNTPEQKEYIKKYNKEYKLRKKAERERNRIAAEHSDRVEQTGPQVMAQQFGSDGK